MGTRGTYGFRKDGKDKLTYNHFDSYPECLGANIVEFIKETPVEELKAICDRIVMVDEGGMPTEKQIKECAPWTNLGVSGMSTRDWYCVLRNAQGDLDAFKKGLRYMIEYGNFIKDSLWCEYGYIINLDDNALEFYIGYQSTPQEGNRYGETPNDEGYYPCRLAQAFPLDAIPENIVEIMEPTEEEE